MKRSRGRRVAILTSQIQPTRVQRAFFSLQREVLGNSTAGFLVQKVNNWLKVSAYRRALLCKMYNSWSQWASVREVKHPIKVTKKVRSEQKNTEQCWARTAYHMQSTQEPELMSSYKKTLNNQPNISPAFHICKQDKAAKWKFPCLSGISWFLESRKRFADVGEGKLGLVFVISILELVFFF